MTNKRKLSFREYVSAVLGVAGLSFRTAPAAVGFKLVGVLVSAVLPIAVTYFAAQTTTQLALAFGGDHAAGERAMWYIVATAGLGLLATAWTSIDQYVQSLVRYKIEARVTDMMYHQFLSLDFWQYDNKETADLYDRAQKFSQFYAYIFDRLAGILSQFITLVFSIVALYFALPLIALVVLIAVIPGVYIQIKISRAQIAHWNNNVDTRRARSIIEWDLLQPGSIAELRLNGLVRHLLDLRKTLRDKDEHERLTYERKFIGKRLLADALEVATELGSLIWIAGQIIDQKQPLGQFVYVQQLVSRALSSASGFVGQLSTIDEDLGNLFDYKQFMELPTSRRGGQILSVTPEVVRLNDVSFRYPGSEQDVLRRISFEIKKGQHIAIVGENGAGKSTLIKLLSGLYLPTKGTITADDISFAELDSTSWHKQLSVLHQGFERYVFTDIQNNVYFGDVSRPLQKDRLKDAIKKAEAEAFIEKLPRKLKTYPSTWMEDEEGNKGTQLSGGQWQRVALARSFYRDAPIIILDEPTSAIDAVAEARIFKRLFAKSNEKTVVTISHRLTTVEKADTIIVLVEGEIAEVGTHAELVQKHKAYYHIFQDQLDRPSDA